MNPIRIHEHFNKTPEGFDISKLRQRTTCLVGLAFGAMAVLPAGEVDRSQLRQYYMDNIGTLRAIGFEVNETVPFNVDRAVDYGFRIYERRWDIANFCNPIELFHPEVFSQQLEAAIPELKECGIDNEIMQATIRHLREILAEKTGA